MFVCVSVFVLLCVIATLTLCNIPYRLQITLFHCKENGCLVFQAPVVIPKSQYHKLLLACYNLILVLFLQLLLFVVVDAKFGHAQKAKYTNTAVLTFSFLFLSSPLISLFLPHFFFSCWAFSRLHFGWKRFLGKLLGS